MKDKIVHKAADMFLQLGFKSVTMDDIAHELGHLLMDCRQSSVKDEEAFAHRFAGAFLVPAEAARDELGQRRRSLALEELALLKRKYGLSMQAWIRRAYDLGIITRGQYRSLFIEFSRQGWKKQEPVSFHGEEQPIKLRQMTLRALAEGIITPERADELCPGCGEPRREPTSPRPYLSAREVMKLPKAERDRILAKAAAALQEDYNVDPEWREFDIYDEDFSYEELGETEPEEG